MGRHLTGSDRGIARTGKAGKFLYPASPGRSASTSVAGAGAGTGKSKPDFRCRRFGGYSGRDLKPNLGACMTTEPEDDDGEFYAEAVPVSLCAGDVHIPDTDLLARDSAAEGVLAVRVKDDLELEYLDGETRVWLNVAVPPGPQRTRN